MYCIKNNCLEVNIDLIGCELKSIKDIKNNKEFLWQGDSRVWGKQSPLLFPFIGRMKETKYYFEGIYYDADIHGYASKMAFNIEEQTQTKIVLSHQSNDETMKVYPFRYKLVVKYELQNNNLLVEYRVINLDDQTIYFSIGGHPAFNLVNNYNFKTQDKEYKIYIERDADSNEVLTSYKVDLETKLMSDDSYPLKQTEGIIDVEKELFEYDTIIIDGNQIKTISLLNKSNEPLVSMKINNFAYLGIWTKMIEGHVGPFICLEPWNGLPDFNEQKAGLIFKKGMIKLPYHEDFTCNYSLTFNNYVE